MTRARKAEIVRKAANVSESPVASEIAQALTDVAAALCFDAATKYEGTAGEQRQIAGVMFQIAQRRFQDVKVDGVKLDKASTDQLEAMWRNLIDGRKRR